jgi:hypothetical protein
MTWLRLKGIKIVRSKGRVYAYHRLTGKRLKSTPSRHAGEWVCTPELAAEIASLADNQPSPRLGSVAALIDSYRRSEAFTELSPVSQHDYNKVIRWIRERAGEASPRGLSTVRVREIRDLAVRKKGWRFGKYVLQVMRVVWQHGLDYGLVQDNPWRSVSYPKRPKKLAERDANRPWTPKEVSIVLKLAPRGLARAYALALLGFRPSDVRDILWTAITSRGVATTSRKTQFDALQHIPASLAWVFEGDRPAVTVATNATGKPFKTDNALAKASGDFLRRIIKSGMVAPGLTMKGLNHTLGTALAERKVDPRSAMDAQQKKTLTTTLLYSRRADTRRNAQEALRELDNWLALENFEDESGKPEQSGT